jgi:hypothetical protein
MLMTVQKRLQQQLIQANLFAASDVGHRIVTPIWQLLPEGTRAAATKLIAQLLTDHQRAVQEDRRTGGHRDV